MSNTNISFGPFISVPVRQYAATESHAISFNMFHVHDDGSASRVSMPCVCNDCGETIPNRNDLVRGQMRGDTAILVTAEELAECETDSGKDFDVEAFVNFDEINPLRLETPYYLEPDVKVNKNAPEGYALIRTIMEESRRVAVVRYTMRGRTHQAILRPVGDVIVMQNVLWRDELREADFASLKKPVELDPKVKKLATQFMEQMVADFSEVDESMVDEYAAKVNELLDAKQAGAPMPVRQEAETVEDVADLMAALEASIARHPAGKAKGKAKAAKAKSA
jgi:DNA end-binding protein Ku